MRSALISMPPAALEWESFPGNIVPRSEFDRIIYDVQTISQVKQLVQFLDRLSIEPFLIIRPEFLSSENARRDMQEKARQPLLHIGLWPYAQPKLVPGVVNFLCPPARITKHEFLESVDLLVDCPMVTTNVAGVIGGLRIADIEANSPHGAPTRLLMPPVDEAIKPSRAGRFGVLRRQGNVSAPLILDFHDMQGAALAMADASANLSADVWAARHNAPATFLTVMMLGGDLPLAIGPLVQELGLMENAGATFDLVIGVEDITEISVGGLTMLLERLVQSIHSCGVSPVAFASRNIRIMSTRSELFRTLVETELNYLIVTDVEALETNGGRTALAAGLAPIFVEGILTGVAQLDDRAVDRHAYIASNEITFGSERQRPFWAEPRLRVPQPAAVRELYERLRSGKIRFDPGMRRHNMTIAASIFGNLQQEFEHAMEEAR